MNSLEINKKYKLKKKLEKTQEKKELELKKIIKKTKEKRDKKTVEQYKKLKLYNYSQMLKSVAKNTKAKETKRNQEIKNIEREIKGHKLVNYKKKDKTLARYKKHSCSDYQRCVRFLAKDDNGFVSTIDGKIRRWNDCDAWHIFSKSKYNHLIFHKYNCFPQSKRSNKELGTSDWLQFKDEVIKRIWKKNWNKLVRLADNKVAANRLYNKQYRKDQYNIWHKKRLKLEKTI